MQRDRLRIDLEHSKYHPHGYATALEIPTFSSVPLTGGGFEVFPEPQQVGNEDPGPIPAHVQVLGNGLNIQINLNAEEFESLRIRGRDPGQHYPTQQRPSIGGPAKRAGSSKPCRPSELSRGKNPQQTGRHQPDISYLRQ